MYPQIQWHSVDEGFRHSENGLGTVKNGKPTQPTSFFLPISTDVGVGWGPCADLADKPVDLPCSVVCPLYETMHGGVREALFIGGTHIAFSYLEAKSFMSTRLELPKG